MKNVAIIVSTAVLTLVVTSALLVTIPGAAQSESAPTASPKEEPTKAPIYSYAIANSFIANMKDNSKRYVKATITLGVSRESDVAELASREYIVKDTIIRVLRGTTEAEYLDGGCQQALGERIKNELNSELEMDTIKEVYFMELVIQ